MTGSAAVEVGGDTAARQFYLRKTNDITMNEIQDFYQTKMCIIDEISFACYKKDLTILDKNLKSLTECNKYAFGKLPVIFLGDFYQLDPVSGTPIYTINNSILWEQALTHMIELKGRHRFNQCRQWGNIMKNIRKVGLTEEDRKTINKMVVPKHSIPLKEQFTMKAATFSNKNRAKWNRDIFMNYLKMYHSMEEKISVPTSAIIIKADMKWKRNGKNLHYGYRKMIFESYYDSDIITSDNKKIDPFLCLFDGSEVMLTENDDVQNGLANGTTATFKSLVMKQNAKLQKIRLNGYWVNTVSIDDVLQMELRYHDSEKFKGTFTIKPKTRSPIIRLSVKENEVSMKVATTIQITQFMINLNYATTAHKLQGKSVNKLIIAEWHGTQNYAYVLLSRVKTLSGLKLLKKIPDNYDCKPSYEAINMMERLRCRIQILT